MKTASGWEPTTLGDIGKYWNGRGFKKAEWSKSGRPIIRIQNLTGTSQKFNYFDGVAEERHTVRQGDLLVSWAATLGVFVWQGPEAVLNQHIFKVESRIDPKFHRYLIQATLDDLMRQTHGSGMVHITKGRFDSTPVLVPPMPDQKRIVEAIDEQFSRLDAAEAGIASSKFRLGMYRTAVLGSSFAGDFPVRPLGEVAETQLGKMLSKKAKRGLAGGRPYLRNKNVQWGRFDLSDVEVMEFSDTEAEKFRLKEGDVLVCEGGHVGRSAIWRNELADCYFQKALHRVRPSSELLPEYLVHYMRRLADTNGFARFVTGSTIDHLPQEDLRVIPIPVPELVEQRRIVAGIEQQLSIAYAIEGELDVAVGRSKSLRRSVLREAFAGRLFDRADHASTHDERVTA